MGVHFITSPTEGRIYLVKRKVSGDKSNRFEPALINKIEERITEQGCSAGFKISVLWMNDAMHEDDIAMYLGLIKDLTSKYLRDESKRVKADLKALEIKASMISYLEGYLEHPAMNLPVQP
jgi:hypothetical protein